MNPNMQERLPDAYVLGSGVFCTGTPDNWPKEMVCALRS